MKGLTPSCPLGQSSQLSPEPVSPGLPLVSQFQFHSYSLHFLPGELGGHPCHQQCLGCHLILPVITTSCLLAVFPSRLVLLSLGLSLHLSHAHTHEWEKGFSPSRFLPHPTALPKTDPNQLESRKQEVRMYRAEDTTSLLNKSNHITASSEQENTWRANRREVDEISKYQRIKIPLPHQTEPSQSARTGTPEITGGFNMPAIQ